MNSTNQPQLLSPDQVMGRYYEYLNLVCSYIDQVHSSLSVHPTNGANHVELNHLVQLYYEYFNLVCSYIDQVHSSLSVHPTNGANHVELNHLVQLVTGVKERLERGEEGFDLTPNLTPVTDTYLKQQYNYLKSVCGQILTGLKKAEGGKWGMIEASQFSQLMINFEHCLIQALVVIPPPVPQYPIEPSVLSSLAVTQMQDQNPMMNLATMNRSVNQHQMLAAQIQGMQMQSMMLPQLLQQEPSGLKRFLKLLFNISFYGMLVMIIGMVIMMGPRGGAGVPNQIGGYALMNVLTGSMEPEIPRQAVIMIRPVNPNELEVGDVVTYLRGNETTVTHRIVEIIENYQGQRGRGFVLQGDANASVDIEVVRADNIMGEVFFVSPFLGAVVAFVQFQPLVIAAFIILLMLSMSVLRRLFEKGPHAIFEQNQMKMMSGGNMAMARGSKPSVFSSLQGKFNKQDQPEETPCEDDAHDD